MEIEFENKDLMRLYESGHGSANYPAQVVSAFFRRMATITGAADERDFYALKGLHFEKIKEPDGCHSMRLNKGWRLILELDKSVRGRTVVRLREINRHYGD